MFCRSLFVLLSLFLGHCVVCSSAIYDSDYPFGIFTLLINGQCILHHQSSFDSMSDSSFLPFVLYRVHVLFMLAVFIYAYWCAARLPYHMMFVSFSNNRTGVTSGAEANIRWRTEFSVGY